MSWMSNDTCICCKTDYKDNGEDYCCNCFPHIRDMKYENEKLKNIYVPMLERELNKNGEKYLRIQNELESLKQQNEKLIKALRSICSEIHDGFVCDEYHFAQASFEAKKLLEEVRGE